MADSNNITEDQLKHLVTFFASRNINPMVCNICNSDKSAISTQLYTDVGFHTATGLQIPSNLNPILHFTCLNCGSQRSFSALVLGLIRVDEYSYQIGIAQNPIENLQQKLDSISKAQQKLADLLTENIKLNQNKTIDGNNEKQ